MLASVLRKGCGRSLAALPGATSFSSERIISIDRSGLIQADDHLHNEAGGGTPGNASSQLSDHLRALIRFRGGPITVAEYISQALTHPQLGYYSVRDAFGQSGDFITSPDISQLFGEMLGVWCVLAWQQMGQPRSVRLAELGPGRGTLMADVLRSTAAFPAFASSLSVSLVEVSAKLREQQRIALGCPESEPPPAQQSPIVTTGSPTDPLPQSAAPAAPQQSSLGAGPRVTWHATMDEIPTDAPLLLLAHEFMDALPVHHFRKTPLGWQEVLVDTAHTADSPHPLRFVLSPGPTPASHLLLPRRLKALPAPLRDTAQHLEICGAGMAACESISQRMASQGGAALIVDYGQAGPYPNSLQAIHNHAPAHPLQDPGKHDLSCRVDFTALRQAVEESGAAASAWGPMHQGPFLQDLGIAARLEALIAGAASDPDQQEALYDGAMRLVSGSQPSPPDLTTPGAIDSSGAHTLTLKPRKGAQAASGASQKQPQSAAGTAGSADIASVEPGMARAPAEGVSEGAGVAQTGEVDSIGVGDDESEAEGMGYQYMAMAISPTSQGAPFPFATSGTAS